MGCDIHLHSEVKINGQWYHYTSPNVSRSYTIFSIMAGVRGSEKPIVTPKGFPGDASEVTKIDYFEGWGEDAHSPSYFSVEEICELERRIAPRSLFTIFGFFFGMDYTDFVNDRESIPKSIEDVRFVFWFDN